MLLEAPRHRRSARGSPGVAHPDQERLQRLFPAWQSGRSAAGLLGLLHPGPWRWLGLSWIVRWSPEALWAQPEGDALRPELLPWEAQETS